MLQKFDKDQFQVACDEKCMPYINRSSKFDVYYANIGNECENVQEKERAVYLDICTHILICQSKVIDPITYFCINYWIFSLWEH